MKNREALFLHWGPGSDASTERGWFRESLPIRWWDQPSRFKSPARAFPECAAAAQAELERMSREQGGPVWIVAHSFGGQLACELAASVPESIAGLTLLSCGSTPVAPFASLGRRLSALGRNRATAALADAFEQGPSPATFWPLMQEIAGTAGFFDLYWKNEAAKGRYFKLNPAGPPLKMDAFQAIIDSRLSRGISRDLIPAQFPVVCYLGLSDPLQIVAEEERSWKSIFPGAAVKLVDSGHFAHLETEPETWAAEVTSWARGASSG